MIILLLDITHWKNGKKSLARVYFDSPIPLLLTFVLLYPLVMVATGDLTTGELPAVFLNEGEALGLLAGISIVSLAAVGLLIKKFGR